MSTANALPEEMMSKDLSTCLCLYQVPDYSVYQNKMYLTGGRPLLDVWPKMAGHGLTCSSRGIIISDGQYSYVLYEQGTFFNIDKKDIVNTGGPEKPGIWLISSMAKMTYYEYGEPGVIKMTKFIYGGSSVSRECIDKGYRFIIISNHMFCCLIRCSLALGGKVGQPAEHLRHLRRRLY